MLNISFGNPDLITVFVRLVLALVCGGVVGLFRSIKRRGAGFRTHGLVCVGSCLVSMTGIYLYYAFGQNAGDVTRLPAQVITGVSFLGVGTIIVMGGRHIKGLTTAAGLWVCSGIGVALGVGFYSAAILSVLIIISLYVLLPNIDQAVYSHSRILDLYIEFQNRKAVGSFIRYVKGRGGRLVMMETDNNKGSREELFCVIVELEIKKGRLHEAVVSEIMQMPEVAYVEEI